MKTTRETENYKAKHRTVGIIAILTIVMMVCTLLIIGSCHAYAALPGATNSLTLEVNMVPSEADPTPYMSDTLSITIFETTTGNQYCAHTTTGSIIISLSSDKHYFIYMSKTGSVTQFIEFQTAGSAKSQSRLFYADYDPVDIADYDGYSMNYAMSVVKFANDAYGTVQIENIGINVLCE